MLLDYTYEMELSFSEPVTDQYFSVMCLPMETERQKVTEPEVTVDPYTKILKGTNGPGNRSVYGSVREPHSQFRLTARGRAETLNSPHEEYEAPGSAELYRYLVPSPFTLPGPALKKAYSAAAAVAPEDQYGRMIHFARMVRDTLRYVPGSTDVRTTAEAALSAGEGVCQDFAHVLVAVLRMAGIPARYVVGLMIGEGESHAWAEANCGGYWYGIDPTNDLLVNESYIKIAHGRDYGDCMISRGIFTNPRAVQTMKVSVSVQPADTCADGGASEAPAVQ